MQSRLVSPPAGGALIPAGAAVGILAAASGAGGFGEVGFETLPDGIEAIGVNQILQIRQVVIRKERHRHSLMAHARRATGAMGVGVVTHGKVVVDHVTDVPEIQAPTGDVGRHHHLDAFTAEAIEQRRTLGLLHAAVNRLHGI